MTPATTITPARQAMLELIKSKQQSRSTSSSSSSSNDSDDPKPKKQKKKFDRPYQPAIKKELDEKRRSAYIVRLGGKMI